MEAEILVGRSRKRAVGVPTRLLGDERLALEVGAGSDRAFTALYSRYHQPLYRYCRSMTGNEQDAQDALQSALTKALVALREGRRTAPLRPWLFRIAHNESILVMRGRSQSQELPAELEAPQDVATTVEERERLALLFDDLRQLPERQRGALVMRELGGLSHEEISQALEISGGAAKQVIFGARRSLLEFAEGRAMVCDEVQRILSDADGRSLRSRKVRAHVRGCPSCAAFASAIPRRRADMLALFPALPGLSAAGLLARITGTGSSHGGGGSGLLAGTAAKGIGATISVKAAALAGVAVVATVTAGAVTVLHHPRRTPLAAVLPGAARSGAAPASSSSSAVHSASAYRLVNGGVRVTFVSRNTRGGASHGSGHAYGARHNANRSLSARNGNSPAGSGNSASPTLGHGHSSSGRQAVARGHSQSTHGKSMKSEHSVAQRGAKSNALHTAGRAKPAKSVAGEKAKSEHRAAARTKTTNNGNSSATTGARGKSSTTATGKPTTTTTGKPATTTTGKPSTTTTGKLSATTTGKPATTTSTSTSAVGSTTATSSTASTTSNGSAGQTGQGTTTTATGQASTP